MIDAMVRAGVAYGPTFVVFEQQAGIHPETLEGDPAFASAYGAEETDAWAAFLHHIVNVWTDEDRDRFRRSIDTRLEWIRRFREAGGRLVVGTDMQYGGIAIHRELGILREVGLSPVEAIAAATGEAARVARLPVRRRGGTRPVRGPRRRGRRPVGRSRGAAPAARGPARGRGGPWRPLTSPRS